MAAEKLREPVILLAPTNASENDLRISRRIYVHHVVVVCGISRARKLLENVAALLKQNGFAPGQISNIQHEWRKVQSVSIKVNRCEKFRN